MKVVLLIVSILLIIIVLLQSSKSEDAGHIISGGGPDLLKNRKERGSELFISRLTFALGMVFFVVCLVAMFI